MERFNSHGSNKFYRYIALLMLLTLCPEGVFVGAQLKDLPPTVLARHIQASRTVPLCIIHRTQGAALSSLEETVTGLWKEDRYEAYGSWQLGAKSQHQPKDPTFSCYLEPSKQVEISKAHSASKQRLRKWLRTLVSKRDALSQPASPALIAHHLQQRSLLLLAFPGLHDLPLIEGLVDTLGQHHDCLHQLTVHPHSEHASELKAAYDVKIQPTVTILENTTSLPYKPLVVLHLAGPEVRLDRIETFLVARDVPGLKLSLDDFAENVLQLSRHHVPTLVCFYAWWSQHVTTYFYAYQRAASEFMDLGAQLRFALYELTTGSSDIIGKHVPTAMARKFPFTVLFKTRMNKTTVAGIDKLLFPGDRPTPLAIKKFLLEADISLMDKQRNVLVYEPIDVSSNTEISSLWEGPHGTMCGIQASNATDNDPAPTILTGNLHKTKVENATNMNEGKVMRSGVDALLTHVGGLPLVTSSTWSLVMESSPASEKSPFHSDTPVQSMSTRVVFVISIIAECDSCHKKFQLFEELHKQVNQLDGCSVYLLNCSSDAALCAELGVSGFPAMSAFRSLAGLDFSCRSAMDTNVIHMQYHGVLKLDAVMAWFLTTTKPAVKHTEFEDLEHFDMEENVRLVGLLAPRYSQYLPHVVRGSERGHPLPFECFRVACEQLYGSASCYVQYNPELPAREFKDKALKNMVVMEAQLWRRDGLGATVMRLGRPLAATLEAESHTNIHRFHQPHRYNLGSSDRCEDDHQRCTQLLVAFTRDHGRLPIMALDATSFHSHQSVLADQDRPVLLALVHQQNMTHNSKFSKSLHGVAYELYSEVSVATLDVDNYGAWANLFVPKGYTRSLQESDQPAGLFVYPRLVLLHWHDHHHAAFYPDVNTSRFTEPPFRFMKKDIVRFVRSFIKDPGALLMPTEHF